jgi:O-antigen/teichoic acid export membrane protein
MNIRRQTLWNLGPMIVKTGVSILSVRIFYHGLGAEMYALLLYVYAMTGTFGFMDLGIGNALARYMGMALGEKNQSDLQEFWSVGIRVGLFFTAAFALVFMAGGVLLGPVWFNIHPDNRTMLQWCFALGGINLFLSYASSLWDRACQVHLNFAFINKVGLLFFLLQIVPSMYLASRFGLPSYLLLWGSVVLTIKFAVFIVYVERQYGHRLVPHCAFSWSHFRKMRIYMLKSFSSLLAGNMFSALDRIVLGRLADPSSFAHYGIAFNGGSKIQALSTSFMGPVFCNTNLLIKGKDQSVTPSQVYDYTCRMMLDWLFLAMTATLFFSHPILVVWLGSDLADNVNPLFLPVFLACCLNAFANLSRAILSSIDRVGFMTICTVVTGLSAAALCFTGYSLWGVKGAAYGYLASRIVVVCMDYITTRRWLHSSGIYTTKTALRGLAYLVAGFAAKGLTSCVSPQYQTWAILCMIMLAAGLLLFVEIKRGMAGNKVGNNV